MRIEAGSVDEYLAKLPAERREMLEAIRETINANIDAPFAEGLQYGMPAWFLPHSVYPAGYHSDPKQPLPFASVASQKNNVSLYLFCVYADPKIEQWFREEWQKTGKRLDRGKSCFRVRRLEEVPLELIGRLFRKIKAKDFVASYEAARAGASAGKGARKKTAKKKPAKKAAKKTTKETAKKAAKKTTKETAKKAANKTKKKTVKKATRKKAAQKKASRE